MSRKVVYPKYELCRWLDTSEESMNQPEATFYYGIKIKKAKNDFWRHCYQDGKAILLPTAEAGSELIRQLEERDAATLSGTGDGK